MVEWKELLRKAVGKLGSQNRLAEAMGCSQAKVSWLLLTAKEISPKDALAVDRATGGEISASDLRPDIWPTKQCLPSRESHEAQAS